MSVHEFIRDGAPEHVAAQAIAHGFETYHGCWESPEAWAKYYWHGVFDEAIVAGAILDWSAMASKAQREGGFYFYYVNGLHVFS